MDPILVLQHKAPHFGGDKDCGETNVQGVLLNDVQSRFHLNAISLGIVLPLTLGILLSMETSRPPLLIMMRSQLLGTQDVKLDQWKI